MVRISKQNERRAQSPRKRHNTASQKTGPKKDALDNGYKLHENTLSGQLAQSAFIPKIK